ncbi:Exopolysaccharide biosynthesis domain protein [Sulfitobacter noctilucicola]|uniref:Mrp family chromosome partitioning ATPase n=1 Tax=Sulfitobacter noctilucicola TaxID=1342301 RepID=A0A7W6M8E5_9RHOB|nr:CpsD/CapB family tyrosine-protein kinase [Sulfitobacter noctilucicola]KIN64476.1 Exopolysaccharide biosynthesis domain protein [Sulfitobacter noctilucicola]MBB4174364.1 Mrp family chromosome partitioning ATPase [Sulfitobacter noctilucicola]
MRDTYGSDALGDDVIEQTAVGSSLGMRHSIRPRRALITHPSTTPAVARRELPVDPTELNAIPPAYVPDTSLPRWHELELVQTGARKKAGTTALPVVDASRDSATVRAFDLLRTRLRQTTQEHGWSNIAITAPTSGCGNTFTAVNLALSLSRISGSRTVLMDFDLRNPGVAQAVDVTARGAMSDFLAGQMPIGDHMVRISDTLALGLNTTVDENAAETLQAAETAHTIERMRAALQPELVLYDMPAMLAHDDVSAFLPQLDGVLLVSDGSQTMARELVECERILDGQVPLLGVVLNRARPNSIPHYN